MVAAAVAAGAVATIGSSVLSSSAAGSAASTAAGAQMQAAQLQQQQYQQTRQDLLPYNQTGQSMLGPLSTQYQTTNNALNTAYGNAQAQLPTQMTQAQLVQTPGYQFNLSQGLQATQNAEAARGLGVSGAAIKQAGTYATGLANSTYAQQLQNQNTIYNAYNQQFSNALNQGNAVYNQIYGPANLGENAAAQSGAIGQAGAAAAGSNIAGAGASSAAGTIGAANALSNGVNSVGQSGLAYLGLQNALQSGNGLTGTAAQIQYGGGGAP